jgi:hypothetical protein
MSTHALFQASSLDVPMISLEDIQKASTTDYSQTSKYALLARFGFGMVFNLLLPT